MPEFERIDRLFRPLACAPAARGLRDDAAVWQPPLGEAVVITTDTMVEGIHFLPDQAAETVGQKLLRCNLSDLAAMAATPVAYQLSIAVGERIGGLATDPWLDKFAEGLKTDQATFDIALLGGDTVSTQGPAVLTVTAFGRVPQGRAVSRAGAQPGDLVCVTGTIGDAYLGLQCLTGGIGTGGIGTGVIGALGTGPSETRNLLSREAQDELVRRHRVPSPRLAVGQAVRGKATAMIDISDGLSADLRHIALASGVVLEISAPEIPLSEPARSLVQKGAISIEALLGGGDDYELAFTLPADKLDLLSGMVTDKISVIGEARRCLQAEPPGVTFTAGDGLPLVSTHAGWEHG